MDERRAFRPREAGEGDHWSSRSERTVVEGAPDSQLRYRCKRISAAELLHLRLERNEQAQCQRPTATFVQRRSLRPLHHPFGAVPLPRYRGGGWKCRYRDEGTGA